MKNLANELREISDSYYKVQPQKSSIEMELERIFHIDVFVNNFLEMCKRYAITGRRRYVGNFLSYYLDFTYSSKPVAFMKKPNYKKYFYTPSVESISYLTEIENYLRKKFSECGFTKIQFSYEPCEIICNRQCTSKYHTEKGIELLVIIEW